MLTMTGLLDFFLKFPDGLGDLVRSQHFAAGRIHLEDHRLDIVILVARVQFLLDHVTML